MRSYWERGKGRRRSTEGQARGIPKSRERSVKCSEGTIPLAGDPNPVAWQHKRPTHVDKLVARILCYPSTEASHPLLPRGKAHGYRRAEETDEKKRTIQGGSWFQIQRRTPPPLVCGDKPQRCQLRAALTGKQAGLSEKATRGKGTVPGRPPTDQGVEDSCSGVLACHQPRSWLPALPGREESNAGKDGPRTMGDKTSGQPPPSQPISQGRTSIRPSDRGTARSAGGRAAPGEWRA